MSSNPTMNEMYANPAIHVNSMMSDANLCRKKDKNRVSNNDTLFSMAFYDLQNTLANRSSSGAPLHLPVSRQVTVPKLSAPIYPSNEYKDMSLREILDLSEDCLFSDDEPSPVVSQPTTLALSIPSVPIPSFPAPVAPVPVTQDDLEWRQMDDLSMIGVEDVPVAADLVAADLVSSMDCPVSGVKRSRGVSLDDFDDFEDDAQDNDKRFRPYQRGQWSVKFEELCEYRKKQGHCLVPHTYNENLSLARWVKRQRYQYKLLKEGKTSTMTEVRVKALEDIGFVWDSQGAAWGERLDELRQYRLAFGHCNVPSNYSENPQLATWVKCQRRQFKLFMDGKPSNMTNQRIVELDQLGFEWELRVYKKQRTD